MPQTDEQRERSRVRAAQWRSDNPERANALAVKSRARRKDKWDTFLAQERDRYRSNRDAIVERQKSYRAANPEHSREIRRRAYRKAPHKAVANWARRRAALLKATPAWADPAAIERFYEEARRLTVETGVPHEVDHIYPLRGKEVCGLHVHTNLRIITRTENRRKGRSCPL